MQARDNKLTIEDMAGGTFTISNVRNSKKIFFFKIALLTITGWCVWFTHGHTNHQPSPNRSVGSSRNQREASRY
jgi:hypothetical protein